MSTTTETDDLSMVAEATGISAATLRKMVKTEGPHARMVRCRAGRRIVATPDAVHADGMVAVDQSDGSAMLTWMWDGCPFTVAGRDFLLEVRRGDSWPRV